MRFSSTTGLWLASSLTVMALATAPARSQSLLINNGSAPPNPQNVLDRDPFFDYSWISIQNAGCAVGWEGPCVEPGDPTTVEVAPGFEWWVRHHRRPADVAAAHRRRRGLRGRHSLRLRGGHLPVGTHLRRPAAVRPVAARDVRRILNLRNPHGRVTGRGHRRQLLRCRADVGLHTPDLRRRADLALHRAPR